MVDTDAAAVVPATITTNTNTPPIFIDPLSLQPKKPKPHKLAGRPRLKLFEGAHRWRLLVPVVTRDLGLTLGDLMLSGRGDAKKRVAAEVNVRMKRLTHKSKDVVTYHAIWKFCQQTSLIQSYFDGTPPSPAEQLSAANSLGGRRAVVARLASVARTVARAKPTATVPQHEGLAGLLEGQADVLDDLALSLQNVAATLRDISGRAAKVCAILEKAGNGRR